jgi:hypothetical protein
MPPVGFEPTISVLERTKTARALERAATAIGWLKDGGKFIGPTLWQRSTTQKHFFLLLVLLLLVRGFTQPLLLVLTSVRG